MVKTVDIPFLWNLLEDVKDPEVPVLSVVDLGVVRNITAGDSDEISVQITPTYSGCPAMQVIENQIKEKLQQQGFSKVHVEMVYSPAWTTDWISEKGKKALEAYGIAPPVKATVNKRSLFAEESVRVRCPHCKSTNTEMISQFGSTACKALYKCADCLEPFDYFKCL